MTLVEELRREASLWGRPSLVGSAADRIEALEHQSGDLRMNLDLYKRSNREKADRIEALEGALRVIADRIETLERQLQTSRELCEEIRRRTLEGK